MRFRLLALLVLAACEAPRIEWSDPVSIAQRSSATRLTIDSAGTARFVDEAAPEGTLPTAHGLCESSLRTVAGTTHLFAVWWSVRPDSSASLQTASSADSGKTWGTAVPVDTSDISSNGCRRPPPAVTAVGDDLHVAYSMVAPEGTGVFFAHFMTAMLHSPVAVIYGERLVPTAIAADGDRVAVAYEEPNGKRRQIDIALSSSQGHIFDWHATASRDVDVATTPAVAIAGHHLAVAWATQSGADSVVSRVVRAGRLR
jgi:hypothetical protein